VSVLLEEGIGCKLAGLAAGGTEEIAVDVIGDAGRFDVIVQTLIETMMAGNVVLLAALDGEAKERLFYRSENSLRPSNSRLRRSGCR
jgi:hypothetical protein